MAASSESALLEGLRDGGLVRDGDHPHPASEQARVFTALKDCEPPHTRLVQVFNVAASKRPTGVALDRRYDGRLRDLPREHLARAEPTLQRAQHVDHHAPGPPRPDRTGRNHTAGESVAGDPAATRPAADVGVEGTPLGRPGIRRAVCVVVDGVHRGSEQAMKSRNLAGRVSIDELWPSRGRGLSRYRGRVALHGRRG